MGSIDGGKWKAHLNEQSRSHSHRATELADDPGVDVALATVSITHALLALWFQKEAEKA